MPCHPDSHRVEPSISSIGACLLAGYYLWNNNMQCCQRRQRAYKSREYPMDNVSKKGYSANLIQRCHTLKGITGITLYTKVAVRINTTYPVNMDTPKISLPRCTLVQSTMMQFYVLFYETSACLQMLSLSNAYLCKFQDLQVTSVKLSTHKSSSCPKLLIWLFTYNH